MKLFKSLLVTHATYLFITAVWPILHIKSFMYVTGPKEDIWLVKTVGALLIPVSLCMFSYLKKTAADPIPLMLLAGGTAISFFYIDVHYVVTGVIAAIYLLDGIAELIFLSGWVYFAIKKWQLK